MTRPVGMCREERCPGSGLTWPDNSGATAPVSHRLPPPSRWGCAAYRRPMRQGSAAMNELEPFRIRPLDQAAMTAARARQAQLVKPPGSLGRLEELAIWLAGVTGEERPKGAARVVVAGGDHGVADEGVSAFPAEVTGQMLATFLAGGGAVSVLARETGAELVCVDAGVAADTAALDVIRTGLKPSANLSRAAALPRADVEIAINTGRELAKTAAGDGITLLIGGE